MDADAALPFRSAPHDALRLGLPAYKEAAAGPAHPVEAIVRAAPKTEHAARLKMLADVYGAGAAARESMEMQILTRPARLPGTGVESSNLGWAALSGALDEFGPEDYLGPGSMAPESAAEAAPVDTHSAMEAALRLGTAPVTRRV